jgi:hypothetical protein
MTAATGTKAADKKYTHLKYKGDLTVVSIIDLMRLMENLNRDPRNCPESERTERRMIRN